MSELDLEAIKKRVAVGRQAIPGLNMSGESIMLALIAEVERLRALATAPGMCREGYVIERLREWCDARDAAWADAPQFIANEAECVREVVAKLRAFLDDLSTPDSSDPHDQDREPQADSPIHKQASSSGVTPKEER